MRERVFRDSETYGSVLQYYRLLDGSYTSNVPMAYVSSRQYSAMADVVIPDFKSKVLAGQLFFNPLYKQDLRMEQSPLIYENEGVNNNLKPFEQLGAVECNPFHVINDQRLTVLDWDNHFTSSEGFKDIAVAQAWANVNISEIQALASLGEMPETIAWIASIFRRALNLVRLFKRKMLTRAITRVLKSNKVDTVSDMWLEFRYAFRPLVFEMRQACTALQSQAKRNSRQTARGWCDDLLEESESWREYPAWYRSFTVTRSLTRQTKVRAGVLYDIETDINGIMAIWGFDQPFETIWELTPFSFILDWFFNIGDVLSSWTSQNGLTPLGSWVTLSHAYSERITAQDFAYDFSVLGANASGTTVSQEPGYSQVHALYKRRIPNPSRALLPSVRINLDVAKITDLAAIGRALLRSF